MSVWAMRALYCPDMGRFNPLCLTDQTNHGHCTAIWWNTLLFSMGITIGTWGLGRAFAAEVKIMCQLLFVLVFHFTLLFLGLCGKLLITPGDKQMHLSLLCAENSSSVILLILLVEGYLQWECFPPFETWWLFFLFIVIGNLCLLLLHQEASIQI